MRFSALLCTVLTFFVAACETLPLPEPIVPTETLAPIRATETPTRVATLVSFPTLAPTTPTVTPTLAAVRASFAPPLVQIVSPAGNAQFSVNQTVQIVAYAAGDAGIARIELFDDNVAVRAERAEANPATFSALMAWTPNQIGAHVLRAVAYDANNFASAPDEVSLSVVPDARKPGAVILSPAGATQVELGGVLPIYAAAMDDAGVTQLDLWVDNQLYAYVASPGAPMLSHVFNWSAPTAGSHTIFLRARDNQDQPNDSAPLRVTVTESRAPVLTLALERAHAQINEPITITITALDPSGIQRIELWSSGQISNSIASSNPARQTSMTMQYAWSAGNAGEFPVMARAYNTSGNSKESSTQTITVLRAGQPTPTRTAAPAPTRTRTPRATATARLQPPAPPTAHIVSPGDRFVSAPPLRVAFGGQGNVELDRVELWGYGQGQTTAQVICTVDARAATQKNAQCEWSPPGAGVVYLYAQVIDSYRQVGKSNVISGVVGLPALATPTPTPPVIAGRYVGTTPPGLVIATLRQVSGAVRGEYRSPTEGDGRITSGSVKTDQIVFHVEFTASALDFECLFDPGVTTLDCTSKDARGRTSSVILRREGAP